MPKRPKSTEAKIVKNMLFRLFLNSASIAIIPDWVRNITKWWSQGLSSDDEFTKSIQWMINNGFIKI